MCGIVGFVSNENKKNKEKIAKKMANKIKHRGPDGQGFYVDEDVVLAQVRLAIIDLTDTGKQPMFNEDETIACVYNGEIYNYLELKDELLEKGHVFKSTSDTEVLIHGYEEYGKDLPKKLRGMFSFAIYDLKEKTLFCARDHFGIKPYYYYKNDDVFMFASEIKSFLEHPSFKKEFNKEVLGAYLSFNFVPTDETFFKNVFRLNPGHSLTLKDGRLEIDKYFQLSFDEKNGEFEEIVNEIADVMTNSVNHHLLSDVEVGSFLSSGIDSSYIVSLAKPDKTYTVGYDIPKYNEIEYAKDLANKLGIKNTSKKITKKEYMDIIPKIMYHMDEPVADPAAVALYFVAELASKDLKVVLSGEGADEFFGGYNYYREEVDYQFYNKIPFFIRKLIASFVGLFPEMRGINFLVRRGQRLEDGYIGVNRVFSEKEANKMLKEKSTLKLSDITRQTYEEQKNKSNIIKMQAIDINFWLIKDILLKADRMSMAHSIEGRVPFIDVEVFNVAKKLPFDVKVTKENTKVALREASKKVIPNESYKKKKLGFPVPLREWMREDDMYKLIYTEFSKPIVNDFFNQPRIIQLLDEHKSGKKDNYKKVWTIYSFLVWYEQFFVN